MSHETQNHKRRIKNTFDIFFFNLSWHIHYATILRQRFIWLWRKSNVIVTYRNTTSTVDSWNESDTYEIIVWWWIVLIASMLCGIMNYCIYWMTAYAFFFCHTLYFLLDRIWWHFIHKMILWKYDTWMIDSLHHVKNRNIDPKWKMIFLLALSVVIPLILGYHNYVFHEIRDKGIKTSCLSLSRWFALKNRSLLYQVFHIRIAVRMKNFCSYHATKHLSWSFHCCMAIELVSMIQFLFFIYKHIWFFS
jgi:hypothetical protein